jgi:hypothetical protein
MPVQQHRQANAVERLDHDIKKARKIKVAMPTTGERDVIGSAIASENLIRNAVQAAVNHNGVTPEEAVATLRANGLPEDIIADDRSKFNEMNAWRSGKSLVKEEEPPAAPPSPKVPEAEAKAAEAVKEEVKSTPSPAAPSSHRGSSFEDNIGYQDPYRFQSFRDPSFIPPSALTPRKKLQLKHHLLLLKTAYGDLAKVPHYQWNRLKAKLGEDFKTSDFGGNTPENASKASAERHKTFTEGKDKFPMLTLKDFQYELGKISEKYGGAQNIPPEKLKDLWHRAYTQRVVAYNQIPEQYKEGIIHHSLRTPTTYPAHPRDEFEKQLAALKDKHGENIPDAEIDQLLSKYARYEDLNWQKGHRYQERLSEIRSKLPHIPDPEDEDLTAKPEESPSKEPSSTVTEEEAKAVPQVAAAVPSQTQTEQVPKVQDIPKEEELPPLVVKMTPSQRRARAEQQAHTLSESTTPLVTKLTPEQRRQANMGKTHSLPTGSSVVLPNYTDPAKAPLHTVPEHEAQAAPSAKAVLADQVPETIHPDASSQLLHRGSDAPLFHAPHERFPHPLNTTPQSWLPKDTSQEAAAAKKRYVKPEDEPVANADAQLGISPVEKKEEVRGMKGIPGAPGWFKNPASADIGTPEYDKDFLKRYKQKKQTYKERIKDYKGRAESGERIEHVMSRKHPGNTKFDFLGNYGETPEQQYKTLARINTDYAPTPEYKEAIKTLSQDKMFQELGLAKMIASKFKANAHPSLTPEEVGQLNLVPGGDKYVDLLNLEFQKARNEMQDKYHLRGTEWNSQADAVAKKLADLKRGKRGYFAAKAKRYSDVLEKYPNFRAYASRSLAGVPRIDQTPVFIKGGVK